MVLAGADTAPAGRWRGCRPGATDDELASVIKPVGVLPSVPENPSHQRRTADALLRILPNAVQLPGCPEPPHPAFPSHADQLVRTVLKFARTVHEEHSDS